MALRMMHPEYSWRVGLPADLDEMWIYVRDKNVRDLARYDGEIPFVHKRLFGVQLKALEGTSPNAMAEYIDAAAKEMILTLEEAKAAR